MRQRAEEGRGGGITLHLGEGARPVRVGWAVFLTLMVLTIVEYMVALVMSRNLPLMIVMNVTDAGLIMYFFMHVVRLWRHQKRGHG